MTDVIFTILDDATFFAAWTSDKGRAFFADRIGRGSVSFTADGGCLRTFLDACEKAGLAVTERAKLH